MSDRIPTIDDTFKFWEGIIFDNEKVFKHVFCKYAIDVVSISWNSGNMKFEYILSCGQHVGDSVKMEKWYDFLKDITCGKYDNI